MKVFILLTFLAVSCFGFPSEDLKAEWNIFKTQHGKSYKSQYEERFRMSVYVQNKNKIENHNAKYEAGKTTFKMKMNHFGDMMSHEIKALMNGYNGTLMKTERTSHPIFIKPASTQLPTVMDWRDHGAVTPVKDQGQCGSCWAFSTTGSLEGQNFRKTGKLISLSEQNLVDCARGVYGNLGCSGGMVESALQYIQDNRGIDKEDDYPYEAVDRQCRFKPSAVGATDKGFVVIEEGNEEDLKSAVSTIGPVSVAIDASHDSFHFYSEGVYYEPECKNSQDDLDHAVLAVGYGSEDGQDYWLVKNSWNTIWGIDGYIKMVRNMNNHCGIASDAVYPLV